MPTDRRLYVGPSLRRLRRDLGLTQADMASDLEVSASYIALLERNHRPLSAEVLLRLAQTYKMDMAALAAGGGAEETARLQAVLKDPMFADIDLPSLETADVTTNFPGVTEALLRLYTAYKEEQLALADRGAESGPAGTAGGLDASDPIAESRRFLEARRNCFPSLDDPAERLAQTVADHDSLTGYFRARHNLRVRRMPPEVMVGSIRRLDRHRREILLSDELDHASQTFQLALQLAYLELDADIAAVVAEGSFTESGERLTRRALASYAAAALLMPYSAFARAVEARRYDLEALARQFGASFEQVAHRLTTLQKPGQERVPFFFIRVDEAGNVSKRLDGAGFPFARHGGGCPLWNVHAAFRTPRLIVTQWLELPDGQRFFSVARTVTAGGGGFGKVRVERAIALGCAAEHAGRLIYTDGQPGPETATPIGVTCRICHRTECTARSAPPIGRQILPDDIRRTSAPFGFSDS
ncbi:short-chain fatty acyl-CoA regulator family protein [Phenylobacterium sp.]|uniref:helix-turn-helix domain-containing protein n=1 Tax=Phenylobacterium sp. TaxID=1871053 RepID=UPI0025D65EA9|nr:short-chain fatty acyl-CoA regulator family protein [Phenylobacterium sp.]